MANRVRITDVAGSTPFDNSTNSLSAEDVQAAIEEVADTGGQARYSVIMGYNGNAGSGRWLELFNNAASNTSPYVVSENSQITSLSVSNSKSADTATFEVFKNGVSVASVSIGENTVNTDIGYTVILAPIALVPGDELSAQQTSSPSTKDPILNIKIKVEFDA